MIAKIDALKVRIYEIKKGSNRLLTFSLSNEFNGLASTFSYYEGIHRKLTMKARNVG